jgi:hypothetical protein
MISFELDSTKEAVTIYFDKDGAEELIDYINFTKGYDDHIHLVIGNELSSVISGQGTTVKHVTIRQVEL